MSQLGAAPALRIRRALAPSFWTDQEDGPSVEQDILSLMTTTPNALVETVKHERMPVLLATTQMQNKWMDGTDEEAFSLCRPYPPDKMRLVRTTYEKRDLQNA